MANANLQKGRHFSREYQPAKRGRRPALLKKYFKDAGVSLPDIRAAGTNLLCMPLSEVRALKKSADEQPTLVSVIAAALIRDYERGTLDSFNDLCDRIWGKPQALLEVSEKRGDIPDDPEERRALIDQIEKELELTVETP
ncbi:MAG: hypothetical protein MdMp014T_0738 [Treponematales bacterium]